MNATLRTIVLAAGLACGLQAALCAEPVGWRGDGSGRYPHAQPPTVWDRRPKGPLRDLRWQARRPRPNETGRPLHQGMIRRWLALGPFPGGLKPLEQPCLPAEAGVKPDENDKVGERTWAAIEAKRKGENFGNPSMDWSRLEGLLGHGKKKKEARVVYAHAYVHSPEAGKVVLVLDHAGPLRAWVNGRQVYSHPKGWVSLWAVNNISWAMSVGRPLPFEIAARRIPVSLVKGWNRILLKTTDRFHLRFVPEPGVAYEARNIAWATPLPARSNASPILVGDRIFLCAEPDELICLRKTDGRILWRRSNSFYDATSEEDRKKHPVFREQITPLVQKLKSAGTYAERLLLRKRIRELLVRTDKAKYEMKVEGHKVSHLPIAGWTTPTPASDGRFVYVWFTHGVAACYDLEGKRRWIRRVDLLIRKPGAKHGPYRYPCSPLLVGDKLVIGIVYECMLALNAADGSPAWTQPEVKSSMVFLTRGRVNGTDVVFSSEGSAVNAADGKVLWKNPQPEHVGVASWDGGLLRLSHLGFSSLLEHDYRRRKAGSFAPTIRRRPVEGAGTDGMYASPLYHEGLIYAVDSHGKLSVIDATAARLVYEQKLDLRPMFHYNACGVASSPTLAGGYIYAMDNQGNAVVFKPGRRFQPVARNEIRTYVHRDYPMNPQETTTYANPVFEHRRLYLRGERHLYCIESP